MKLELIEQLKKLAARDCWSDDPGWGSPTEPYATVDDFAAGNIDDAYYGGFADGEAELAREVLADLGIEAKNEV